MNEIYSPNITINRSSGAPLYVQIADPIEKAILSGELAAGTLIEDEISMAQRLKVARPTARRALQELTTKGLITRRRGVGTRVTPPHVHRPMKLSSLNEDLIRAGLNPTTKTLSYEIRESTADEAEELQIKTGDSLVSITRLRYADKHPLALMANLIPFDIAPTWHDLNEKGLYECLREKDIEIATATQEIGAREASESEAETLEEETGAPLLVMRRVARTDDGRVVEVGDHLYRASLYSFRFSLFSQ